MRMDKIFDVIIIGGGPAGVSAALYAARGGMSVCVVHNKKSALHSAKRIENYYGTGAVEGAALYDAGLVQAESVGAVVISDEVTFAEFDGKRFVVTAVGGKYSAARLVVATGASHTRSKIEGLDKLEGKGVGYCAVCDGFFYRKKAVGVLGAGDYAEHEHNVLCGFAGKTYLLTDGAVPSFSAADTIDKKISRARVGENGRFCGVEFVDGTTLELDGLFVALGVLGSSAIAKSMGVFTDERGAIKVDGNGMTNVAGLYAAGDCTSGIKQIGRAVADGMTVGTALAKEFAAEKRAADENKNNG